MAQHYSPRIVTDGLILCLDAADKNSYSGSIHGGVLSTWSDLSGQGNNGKLGQGNTISHSSMVQVAGTTWAQCSGGNDFTLATKTDGTIWGWGDGGDGRTWHNTTTSYTSPVQGIAGTDWWGAKGSVDIADGWEAGVESSKFGGSSQGYWSSMVIDVNGKPWGVGWNALGNYAMSGSNNSPRQVGSDTTWTNLSHDGFGGCGINNGAMFAWGGYNITGDLGNGNTTYAAGTLYSWAGTGTATDCASGSNLYAQKLNGMIVGGTLYFSGHNAIIKKTIKKRIPKLLFDGNFIVSLFID